MKIFQLLEAINLQKTLDNYADKLEVRLEQDHSATNISPEQAIQQFQKADPTPNDQYTLWMIRTYLNKGVNYLEDLSRVNQALILFHKFKQKLQTKDINQIKSLNQLEELVSDFEEQQTQGELDKQQKQAIYNQSEVIYKGSEGMIVVPKTEEASCYWGRGTKWCTAATTSDNMFSHYNQEGKLYILMYPDGVKYQFHLQTGQFMDERDEEINFEQFKKSPRYGLFSKLKFSEEEQLAAVQEDGYAIKYINNPSEAVQLAAVQQDGHAIKYINNPSEAVQLAAVQQDGRAIRYIKNPSEAVQLAAVQRDGNAIYYINNPSEAVQLAAVQQDGRAIRYIKNPSEAVQLAAVKRNGLAIEHINNPSEAVQLAAVQQDGIAIDYIKNPSEAVQLAAVQQYGYAIQHIKNPSEAVQLAAVKQNGYVIEYINNPSEAVQLAAVKRNGLAIEHINNPTPKAITYVKKHYPAIAKELQL